MHNLLPLGRLREKTYNTGHGSDKSLGDLGRTGDCPADDHRIGSAAQGFRRPLWMMIAPLGQERDDFANARQEVFEQEIRQTGFFRNKAKNIIAAAGKIAGAFGGRVPDTIEELITLPVVARKTANIVLSSAFNKAEGIAVDVHVARLAQRLGLSKETNTDKIEKDLMACLPRSEWIDFNYMMVDHGRKTCAARKPLCAACVLRKLCPSADHVMQKAS